MQKKDKKNNSDTVNIRPGVSVLSVLRHLNYTPWFALAEFVDNAVQSFIENSVNLKKMHGADCKVKIYIEIDATSPGRISIKDNAGGIAQKNFPRAFRPAAAPENTKGLSEFGMGMKSAACWFSRNWYVRTKALGEDSERTVKFDVNKIVHGQLEELGISSNPADEKLHFTEVVLEDLHHLPVGRTVGKIKEHLTDIYRVYVRNGLLELYLNGERLKYSEPPILEAPYAREKSGAIKTWETKIDFNFGKGQSVKGFAALRDPGNTARSGFALFRRDRLIQGSGDDGYRPKFIFVQPNSYRYQRLFGELHLKGFEVSHTKDGFRWDENEEKFLNALKKHLDSKELPLLRQADGYRARASREVLTSIGEEALDSTIKALQDGIPAALPDLENAPPVETSTTPLPAQTLLAKRELTIDYRDVKWTIKVELADDPAESQWLKVSDQTTDNGSNVIEIRVTQTHPFMERFTQLDANSLEAVLRLAAGLALAEKVARISCLKHVGTIRRNLNEILFTALSKI